MNRKTIIAGVAFLLSGIHSFAQTAEDSLSGVLMKQLYGKVYPLFDFKTSDGVRYTSENTKGKVVFFSFWISGCGPCRVEVEGFNKMYAQLKDNPSFVFLAITYDESDSIPGILKKFKIHFPIAHLSRREIYNYNFRTGFPTNIILDKNGKIAFFKTGGTMNKTKAEAEITNIFMKKIEELL